MLQAQIKTRLPQLAALAAVIVVGAAVILLTTSGPPGVSAVASSGSGNTVDISDFKYDPADLTVSPGTKVTFVNEDSAAHTATSDTEGAFDTGDLSQGDKATVTLKDAGTFTYICQFHTFMKGTITVK